MQLIKTFKENKSGRDFFTTDLHGCYDLLHEQMRLNAFDTTKDRLFVGGDNCDRNPDSTNILDYIYEPWFHSIRCNHNTTHHHCNKAFRMHFYLLDSRML